MSRKKAEPITDEELQTYMKDAVFYRKLKNYFSSLDSETTGAINTEFDRRRIKIYLSDEVQGDITIGEAKSPNARRITKDFPLDELYSMGALKVDLKKFQEKTKKSDEEMQPYISKKPGKRQLNIRPTEAMSKEVTKRIMEKIYAQMHEEFD